MSEKRKHSFKEGIALLDTSRPIFGKERQYVEGGFFLGIGSIRTSYRKDLIGYEDHAVPICVQCHKTRGDNIHQK